MTTEDLQVIKSRSLDAWTHAEKRRLLVHISEQAHENGQLIAEIQRLKRGIEFVGRHDVLSSNPVVHLKCLALLSGKELVK